MRYNADLARKLGENTYAALSDAGNRPPNIEFSLSPNGLVLTARPDGAAIQCVWLGIVAGDPSRRAPGSAIRVTEDDGTHIAHIIAFTPQDGDDTEEAIAIASALYWSWWRARDMRRHLDGGAA